MPITLYSLCSWVLPHTIANRGLIYHGVPPPPQGVPVEGSTSELFLHLHYKDLQSDLPSKVRCSNPGEHEGWRYALSSTYPWWPLWCFPPEGLPVDRTRIKQAFLSLPIAEAFQHLFLDQNIEQGWIHCLPSCSHNDCWHRKIIFKNHIKWTRPHTILTTEAKLQKVLYVYKLWLFLVLYFLHSDIFEELVDIYHHGWALDIH